MFNPKTNNSLIHLEQNKYLENIINKKSFANGYIFYGPMELVKNKQLFTLSKKSLKNILQVSILKTKFSIIIIPIF